jgi:hypothetical protein
MRRKKMGDQKLRVSNVQLCLEKLQAVMDALPSQKNDTVDVANLVNQKKIGQKAVDHLKSLFGTKPDIIVMKTCEEGEQHL